MFYCTRIYTILLDIVYLQHSIIMYYTMKYHGVVQFLDRVTHICLAGGLTAIATYLNGNDAWHVYIFVCKFWNLQYSLYVVVICG